MPNPRFLRTAERWMNKEIPEIHPKAQPKVSPISISHSSFSIDDILKGKTFYSNEQDNGKYIGVPVALQQALEYATNSGIVATMPELIAAKVKADKTHDFWKQWYTVHTEENIGIDKKGRFYAKNKPILAVVNGGGILTPERIKQAYSEGLIDHSAKYTDEEFDSLLDGKLPDGSSLKFYTIEDIKKGISNLPHRFGVVMPYELAQKTESKQYQNEQFLENPLVIARNGGLENLESYFEKAKDDDGLGNWHVYKDRDASVPQGRLLYLVSNFDGLDGDLSLDNLGRFVGVAPEARAKK